MFVGRIKITTQYCHTTCNCGEDQPADFLLSAVTKGRPPGDPAGRPEGNSMAMTGNKRRLRKWISGTSSWGTSIRWACVYFRAGSWEV